MYSLSCKQKLQCYFDPGVLQLATSDANCDLTWFSSEVVTLELAVLVGVFLNKLPSVVVVVCPRSSAMVRSAKAPSLSPKHFFTFPLTLQTKTLMVDNVTLA